MSFDPHAYRVALLEQLTAGSTPPLSPQRTAATTPQTPPQDNYSSHVRNDGPDLARSVFDRLSVEPVVAQSSAPVRSLPPQPQRYPHSGGGGVVLENSTLSAPPSRAPMSVPGASTFVATPRAAPASGSRDSDQYNSNNNNNMNGLVDSHLPADAPVRAVARRDVPNVSMFSILEESPRSLISDFVDRCIAAGVPDDVTTQHVQFMMYAMKEIVSLHEALHARFQHDRVRDYEINELTNMVEQQYALATSQSNTERAKATTKMTTADRCGSSPRGMWSSPRPIPPTPHGVLRRDGQPEKEPERRSLSFALRQASDSAERQKRERKTSKSSRRDQPRTTATVPSSVSRAPREGSHATYPYRSRSPNDIPIRQRATSSAAASSSSPSTDLDLESLRREKGRVLAAPGSSLQPSSGDVRGRASVHRDHQPQHVPSTRHLHSAVDGRHGDGGVGGARSCPCCQPGDITRAKPAASASVGATHGGVRASPHQQQPRAQRPARPKPAGAQPVRGTPGFMAPTHLSLTRERLAEATRRQAAAEEAEEAAARVEEGSAMRERSRERRAVMAQRSSLRAGSAPRGADVVHWVPPRSTRASELRAAYIQQKAHQATHDDDDDAEEEGEKDNSPRRPAPRPPQPASSPSRRAPSCVSVEITPAASSASSFVRSATEPPPPSGSEEVPRSTVRDTAAANPRTERALYTSSSSLQLSPPPRFEPLATRRAPSPRSANAPAAPPPSQHAQPQPALPPQQAHGTASSAWHRTRTPTPPVQVTSPRLQLFLERGHQKVREAERVLTQTPPVTSVNNSGVFVMPNSHGHSPLKNGPRSERREERSTPREEERFAIHELRPRFAVEGTTDRSNRGGRSRGLDTDVKKAAVVTAPSAAPEQGQSPLVVISPTTSSSSGCSATGSTKAKGDDEAHMPEMAADEHWRRLYSSPRTLTGPGRLGT